jgi:hypothetical protein
MSYSQRPFELQLAGSHEPKYKVVSVMDGTFTVERSDGPRVIMMTKGFVYRGNVDVWIKEQKRALEAKAAEVSASP